MIARLAKYLLLTVVVLSLTAVLVVLWLIETESGSRWLWNRALPAIPGELQAQSVEGSIGNGFNLAGVSYSSDAVELDIASARIAVEVVLFPLTIDLRQLKVEGVVIRQKETEPPAEPGGPVLERLALPLTIVARDVSVRDLLLLASDGGRLFSVDSASLAGRWSDEIDVSRLELESDVVDLEGTVFLALAEPHAARASLDAVYPLQTGDGPVQPVRIRANAAGSLREMQVEVSTEGPAVHVAGSLHHLTESPGWDVRVQSPYLQWPLVTDPDRPPQVYLRSADLQSSGELSAWTVSGHGLVSVSGTEELPFDLRTTGNRTGVEVTNLAVQGRMLAATASGTIGWSQGFALAADADVSRFDANALTPHWPAGQPVSGTVDAAFAAGNVQLNEVRLRVAGAPTTVDATGKVDLEGGVVDLNLDWRDLRWPMTEELEEGATRVVSEFGQVDVSGSPDAWAFDGQIAFRTNALPQGVFVLSGSGSREAVEATLNESRVLGGTVSGQASYDWANGGQWSAELVSEEIDISPLAPDFRGRISSDFAAEGRMDPLQFAVDISRLDGTLRDRPVQGEGGVSFVDGKFQARQLRIAWGDAELQADGNPESEAGLEFAVDVAALEAFYPALAGSLQASGNVSMAQDFPSLRLDLEARELYWGEYALQELSVTSGAGRDGMPLSLEATATGLSTGAREIDSVRLQLDAGENRQRLELELSPGEDQQAVVELDGRLGDWRKPLESVWTGQLVSAAYTDPEATGFALEEPSALRLSTGLLTLAESCFAGGEDGRVCIESNWAAGQGFDLAAQMDAVPANLAGLFYETDLEFTQTLGGRMEITGGADGVISGHGQIDISPGRIRNRDEPQIATETGAGRLQFSLDRGQLLAGRLLLPFSNSAEIEANFEAADISTGKNSAIDGKLRVHLNDLAVAANVIPVVEDARGRLDVDLDLGGTLGGPVLSGEASLANGSFHFAPLGLRLADIELRTVIRDDNRIDLQSTFRAGEGTGELRSSATSLDGLRDGLEFSLRGDNLTVIDLPDINVIADADLAVGIRQDTLTINGNVLVPRARLTPVNLTSDKISESEDVVIVANGNGEAEEANGNGAPFKLAGTVALTLGNDVVVDLDVAEARVRGTSAFHWDGPHMPVANGQYNIEGRFEAYGQLLDITEGTIRFPGVPASQPNLRIRAEREIFGNPQIRSAGVLVTGAPQQPQVEVYTNPPTRGDRALTLLVTGSDFNYEQGVGAVDVGTYIAPKLFISYGIGLFERGNVISLRYDIAKGFGIKATSGRNTEGVDLSYTVEH